MNNTARDVVVAIAVITLLFCSCSETRSQKTFSFTHVNVVPMDRVIVLKDQTVIVENGRVVEVGPSSSATIPDEAMEMDAKEEFMIPAWRTFHTPGEYSVSSLRTDGYQRAKLTSVSRR